MGTIAAVVTGVTKLPAEVKEVKEDVSENKDSINKLAHTVDKYIEVQAEHQKAQQMIDKEQSEAIKLLTKIAIEKND